MSFSSRRVSSILFSMSADSFSHCLKAREILIFLFHRLERTLNIFNSSSLGIQ